MTIEKRGDYYYGENQVDLHAELQRYAELNGYLADHFSDARCQCQARSFNLQLDDVEGVAVRICTNCNTSHPIGDSAEFLEDAELEECACPCGAEVLEISVAVSLYDDAKSVRWLYLGCRCPKCGLVAVYGEWKNEHEDYAALLANV